MISPRPMDRLVCGDVGFGKTEVALRAAFIAVTGGRQVAFLAPTTLLAEQHFQTLVDRFAKWPVKIAEVSRFRSGKEITATLKGLADGTVDIVVGTHKLLSASTKFKNLGLLIIDEEHRFGVRHKEAMKAMRAEVDVLTLTATPIPRTLGMALEGLRDLSVIATAPQRRLAIKTFVRNEGNGVIREAVLRELKRGGQVYFLHNEVETIQNRRERLEELLPEARIAVAHGQMHERELERVMRDFVAQRYNLLLCSTIIETGIDVPTANTIVISRADKFGLAQLHQLRGRVGRSHHQAYAYLMVPDMESLTRQAAQRLDAIQQMEELGSGFYLAMHDLEIRGAGEVLGENQSGNMLEVGFQLYNEMLAEAVRSLKAGKEPDLLAPLSVTTEINLHAPALLPERLLRRRAPAAVVLQAAGHGQDARADRRPAGRDRRPLRQAAAAGADTDRRAPAAGAGPALRRGEGGRRAGRHPHHLQAGPADRSAAHHRAGAEEPPHPAGRQRKAAHRARAQGPEGPRADGARRAAFAGPAAQGSGRGRLTTIAGGGMALELVLVVSTLALSLALRPWRLLAGGRLLTPLLATLALLPWLWALPALQATPLQLQWSGACLVLLMLGWPLAIPVLCLTALLAAWIAPVGASQALGMATWLGVVPATLALGLGARAAPAAGHPPFHLRAGTGLPGLGAVPVRGRVAAAVDRPCAARRRERTDDGRALADGLGRRGGHRHADGDLRGLPAAVAGHLVGCVVPAPLRCRICRSP